MLINRPQVQLGFVLILLALLGGFAVSSFAQPRLGLSAHLAGLIGGLLLIALGMLDAAFILGARSARLMRWSWTYAAYANWAACLVAAMTGASRLTPIAGAGSSGNATAESVVALLLQSLALAAIIGSVLSIRGLRSTDHSAR